MASARNAIVRPYEADDRSAVRHICFVTGFMGDPVDWQWRDAESFADMFSGYYTDREPESAYVVEIDGEVAGYLLGCVASERAANAGVVALRHVLRRGIAFRRGTAAMLWRSVADVVGDLARRRITLEDLEFADARWPAHLHIDLLAKARGTGAGSRLVGTWLDVLRGKGVAGCHLRTMAENTVAIAFFESMGFRPFGEPTPAPGIRSRAGERLHIRTMVCDLRASTRRIAGSL